MYTINIHFLPALKPLQLLAFSDCFFVYQKYKIPPYKTLTQNKCIMLIIMQKPLKPLQLLALAVFTSEKLAVKWRKIDDLRRLCIVYTDFIHFIA